ncbi:hypothetical protein KHA94_16315 [Bacillus sp. FJAT-49705]|uniref:Transglycosylase n=1 Tax=Cytobacillus citreus TaxID=2833586 RepID=A0ABS5NVA7_9BACI|nr:hypothetical protein [Cytobacillus citreus]MBS4191755.1 hypothetical protein [Cytobacillus citreus]
MSKLAYCNEGCNNQFYLEQFKSEQLPGNIEKVFFNCPHCDHEYICYYTDLETRKLQEQMQKLHKRFANPNENENKNKLIKQEAKLKKKIKAGMDKTKKRVEG